MANLTTASNIAKEVYGPRIVEQLNDEQVVPKRMQKSSKGITSEVGGKYVTFPIRTQRNNGIGYRGEDQTLQAAGSQGWESVRTNLRYGYGRVYLTGPSMDLLESNTQAFSALMTREMEGLKNDVLKDTSRIFYGDGTGKLAATAAAGTAATTYVADNIQYLEIGQIVDIVAPGGTVKATGVTITAINESNNNVTISAASTWASGDLLVRTGNFGLEPQGFASIVKASGTLFNVNPTTVPVWKATESANGGTPRALSESLMIRLADDIRRRGGKTSVIFSDLASRRSYFNLLSQQRRYNDTKTFDGGFSGLAFNYGAKEIAVVEDIDAPPGKMWFIDESSFQIHRSKDWHFADTDGNVWKWVTNKDAFEALLRCYWEFTTERRNANGVLADITGS